MLKASIVKHGQNGWWLVPFSTCPSLSRSYFITYPCDDILNQTCHPTLFSQYMKMMGVSPTAHFFAWFLECAAFLVITISILTIILKAGHVLPQSDGLLLFLYLCDYGLSIIAMSFLISSFFDKTNIAGLSGSLIYIICFFPYIVVMSMESSLTDAAKNALVRAEYRWGLGVGEIRERERET